MDKETAKDFVIAMIQRGYFDDAENDEMRIQKIVSAYNKLLESRASYKKAHSVSKSDLGL